MEVVNIVPLCLWQAWPARSRRLVPLAQASGEVAAAARGGARDELPPGVREGGPAWMRHCSRVPWAECDGSDRLVCRAKLSVPRAVLRSRAGGAGSRFSIPCWPESVANRPPWRSADVRSAAERERATGRGRRMERRQSCQHEEQRPASAAGPARDASRSPISSSRPRYSRPASRPAIEQLALSPAAEVMRTHSAPHLTCIIGAMRRPGQSRCTRLHLDERPARTHVIPASPGEMVRGRVRVGIVGRRGPPRGRPSPVCILRGVAPVYFTTSNGRIMSFSSCSRMWQW